MTMLKLVVREAGNENSGNHGHAGTPKELRESSLLLLVEGGAGSGNKGHAGRKGEVGGSGPAITLKAVKKRAFNGTPVELKSTMSKQDAGKLGEEIVIAYLRKNGMADADHINSDQPNFPIDVRGDHTLIEVKTGLVSNGPGAQQWRATIGQPGKAETEWLRTASPEDKAAHNLKKSQDIMDRKNRVLADYEASGEAFKSRTMTVLLNPDTRTADVHIINGFHLRIGWNSPESKAAYVGSFKY